MGPYCACLSVCMEISDLPDVLPCVHQASSQFRSQDPAPQICGLQAFLKVLNAIIVLKTHLLKIKERKKESKHCQMRVFTDDAQGCQCPFVLCLHPQVFLQRGVLASGSFQEWTVKLGSFGMWHHPRGYVSNFLLRKASSLGAPGWAGTPSRQSRGIYPPVVIRRGESDQMKWCRELRCSPR